MLGSMIAAALASVLACGVSAAPNIIFTLVDDVSPARPRPPTLRASWKGVAPPRTLALCL